MLALAPAADAAWVGYQEDIVRCRVSTPETPWVAHQQLDIVVKCTYDWERFYPGKQAELDYFLRKVVLTYLDEFGNYQAFHLVRDTPGVTISHRNGWLRVEASVEVVGNPVASGEQCYDFVPANPDYEGFTACGSPIFWATPVFVTDLDRDPNPGEMYAYNDWLDYQYGGEPATPTPSDDWEPPDIPPGEPVEPIPCETDCSTRDDWMDSAGFGFDGSSEAEDPVDTRSGAYKEEATDLAFPSQVLGMDYTRTYNSFDDTGGVLGAGWTATYDQRLVENQDGSVTLVDADGRRVEYLPDGAGGFVEPLDHPGNLIDEGDTYRLEFPDSTTWEFDAEGRIDAIGDWTGQVVAIGRDGAGRPTTVVSSTGYSLTFSYGANALLSRVTSSDGRTVDYGYGADDTLNTVTYADGGTDTYVTDAEGRITEVRDQEGRLVIANAYDPATGRVVQQTTPHGDTVEFSYDDETGVTAVSDQILAETTSYQHGGDNGELLEMVDPTGASAGKAYNPEGRLSGFTDRSGAVYGRDLDADTGLPDSITAPVTGPTDIDYDDQNRVSALTDSEGGVSTYSYDGQSRVPATVTDPEGNQTQLTSTDGLVTSVTDPDGVTTSFGYDSARNLTSVTDGAGNTTTLSYVGAGWVDRLTSALGLVSDYDYDAVGRTVRVTDPTGAVTTTSFDRSGRVLGVTDPLGAITSYAYDTAGEVATMTDANGATTSFAYNAAGQLTSMTAPGGAVTTYDYGPLSRLESVTDPEGVVTSYGYDDNGRQTSVTDAAGNSTQTVYDAKGRVIETIDAAGNSVSYGYDDLDQLTSETTADGTTSYTYDATGNLLTVTDPRGVQTTNTYTPGGRLASSADGAGNTTTFGYDPAGRLETTTDPLGNQTANAYDADGRLVSVSSPEGRITTYAYDGAGRTTAVSDAAGTWQSAYDARGEVVSRTDPTGGTVTFAYDGVGNLISVTDALGELTTMAYDARGNRVSRTAASTGASEAWSYDLADRPVAYVDQLGVTATLNAYNNLGQLETVTDATGRTQALGYDAVGRLTSITYGDGSGVGLAYDALGRRTSMTDPLGTTSYSYDTSGNLTGVTEADGDVIAYGYDSANRRDSITYPDGDVVTHGYNAAGWLETVAQPSLGTTVYGYDGDGLLVTEDLPGSDSRSRSYDSAGRLSGMSQTLAGVTSSYGISRDGAGRITAMTTGGPATWDDWSFTYDAAGQLTAANRGSPGGIDDFAYTYDASGNRLTQAKGGFIWTQSFNAANQMTSSRLNAFTPWSYSYDAAGRRTNATQASTRYEYDYDAAGRLDQRRYTTQFWIFTSTWTEDYSYDGEGQLAGLTVTEPNRTVHDYDLTWDDVAEVPQVLSIDDGGGDDSFVYGANRIGVQDASGSTAVFSYDPFGSALATTATAEWARSASYSPFGQQQNAAWADPLAHAPAFGYRGELTLDNTIHLRARTYEPTEGVFTTRDPLDGVAGTTTVTSPYAYANNNPLNLIDPLGLSVSDEAFEAMIGGWTPRMSTSECLDLANALRDSLVGSGVNSTSDFDFCKQFLLGDEAYDIYDRYQGMCETGGYPAACYAASFLDHGYPASRADDIIDYYCNGPGDNWSLRNNTGGGSGCDEGVVTRDHLTEFLLIDLPIAVSTGAFTKLIKIPGVGGGGTGLQATRQTYVNAARVLADEGAALVAGGESPEVVARAIVPVRNMLKAIAREPLPTPIRKWAEWRNIRVYGNPLGPTYEWLTQVAKKTPEEIISGAGNTSSWINWLLGVS